MLTDLFLLALPHGHTPTDDVEYTIDQEVTYSGLATLVQERRKDALVDAEAAVQRVIQQGVPTDDFMLGDLHQLQKERELARPSST